MKDLFSKRLLLTLACLAAVIAPAPAGAQSQKIAVVITQKLLAATEMGRGAAKRLQARKESAQEKLDAKGKEIQDLQEDLSKRALVLSEEERRKARDQFDRQQRDAQRMKEDLERELKKAEAEILGGVNEFLTKIIIDFGKKNGYDIVIDATATVYFSDASDITDQLIEAANSAYEQRE